MPNVTDEIKEKIDIVEFIGQHVQLKKAGRNFVGFCPFHPNSRTPAFTVFPDTQSYHCFGCKASGTVFDFLMQREGLEFREALEQLARRAGVQLHERTEQEEQQDRIRTRLLEINAAAAAFFHHVLVKSQRGEPGRAYVAKRRIDQATVESFQLGYAVDDWSALLGYLAGRKGFEPEEIEAAGLAIRREGASGGFYDRFRGRLMFPIRNPKGEVIAFGGRALGDAQPKYMNSPQTLLFDKSRVLYGLDLARDSIRNQDAAVIVEGYVDVIIAHQHGFRNVVAPLGTALTGEHIDLIKKSARHIFLALDADPAGVRATLKGLQSLQENPEGELTPITSPQGIVGWSRKLEIEIKIIGLPDGRDPDEVIQESPERWKELVAQARPAMDFYIDILTSDLDLTTGRGKAEAVARLAPLIVQIANPVEQAHHIQQIARLIDIEEQYILRALPSAGQASQPGRRPGQPGAGQLRPQAPAAGAQRAAPRQAPPQSTQEDYLLGWLLRYPSARAAVEEKIRRDMEPFPLVAALLSEDVTALFERVENRALWSAWEGRAAGAEGDVEQWADTLDEALGEQARRVLALKLPDPQAYRYMNDALECATILQQQYARRWLARVTRAAAEADDDDERLRLLEQIVQIKEYLGAISAPRRSSAYADLHTLHSV